MSSAIVQIMDAIRLGKGNASKKDIQETTGVAWGTMCKDVDALLGGGYVFARREKAQGRRRPVIPLCVNSDAAYYVGLDIGASATRVVICNLAFNTVYMNEVSTPRYAGEVPFFAFLGEVVDTALRESRIERDKLEGIGISVSGSVDFERGIIVSAGNFGLPLGENLHITDYFAERYGVGAYAVTTQAAAPAAEYNFGEMAGCDNLLTVGLGVGIGSGAVTEGQLLITRPGRPVGRIGHIGHIMIIGNQRVCVCGFRGCLEAYSGGNSLVAVAHERFPERTDFDSARALDLAAANGDADARSILDTAALYNAAGISNMIQIYVPDAIIFGGGQCREDGYLYQKTLEEIRNILPRERLENIRMSITTLGKYQSALGAARLAYEKFFGEIKKEK